MQPTNLVGGAVRKEFLWRQCDSYCLFKKEPMMLARTHNGNTVPQGFRRVTYASSLNFKTCRFTY